MFLHDSNVFFNSTPKAKWMIQSVANTITGRSHILKKPAAESKFFLNSEKKYCRLV